VSLTHPTIIPELFIWRMLVYVYVSLTSIGSISAVPGGCDLGCFSAE
jgi:hypothetical protein